MVFRSELGELYYKLYLNDKIDLEEIPEAYKEEVLEFIKLNEKKEDEKWTSIKEIFTESI